MCENYKGQLLPINAIKFAAAILNKMSDINKWQSDFLTENVNFQCRMRGWHNFLNMSPYSE